MPQASQPIKKQVKKQTNIQTLNYIQKGAPCSGVNYQKKRCEPSNT
jgi:hypothetical protein